MEEEVISISDSDEEAAPFPSSSNRNPAKQKHKQQQDGLMTPTYSSTSTASISSGSSITPSPLLNLDLTTQSGFESTSGMGLYKPLGADLLASRNLEALRNKKRLSIMAPFPAVRDVVNKMRSALGTNDSPLIVLGLAQQYISSLKIYQATIFNCPNRCRLLARHMIRTMCLIRDLSRHFFDSPHYSQKMCELLAIYIHFELQCAGDFKDSKIKIAERIIHNIHLHLENAQSNFVLRIFSFINNMGKENEIATKVFQRLIPEPTIMIKHELSDRLFIQYLIAFYHWKETWNDYEDQQKVVSFANKFMKPMSSIKNNKMYSQHLPCYMRRDDAAGYFLTNLVFFNDLRNASILDGTQENGPAIVDLSEEDDKEYPIIDLSEYTMEPLVKAEPGRVVDLTSDANEPWLNRLIRRAVALEVILPARLANRNEDQVPAVIELSDSDNENANNNDNAEKENDQENENENEKENEDDDSWAFAPTNEQQQQAPVEHLNLPADEESNSMDELYNEMNSSIDFVDDSTTESEIERKKGQKERFEIASKLTDAQARITFDGIVEKELKAKYFQTPTTSNAAVTTIIEAASTSKVVATTSKVGASDKTTPSLTPVLSKPVDQSTISNIAPVGDSPTSSKAAVAIEKTASMETVEIPTKKHTSMKTAEEVHDAAAGVIEISNGDATAIEESLFTSDAIQEVEKTAISNREVLPTQTEPAAIIFDQEKSMSIADRSLTQTTKSSVVDTILQETQAPKEAITLNIDETLLSSFDSSDESDEDFLGRFQQPPFKTYLRRAHRRPSKKSTKHNNTSSSEEEPNVEKNSCGESESNNRPRSPTATLPLNEGSNENANILFSGKVISLREDESSNGGGGVTPNYLNIPESIEVSKHGSNVVFSMQGRRLSSFPSLKATNDQGMPDFDADISMTGEEDSNSRTEEITPKNKSVKKSNISSNMKNQNSSHNTDKHTAKVKSVWFAENPQVREIEARTTTSSQQKQSAINAISSTINKISANKQHFTSKIFSSPSSSTTSTKNKTTSTIKSTTFNLSESNKISKPNHLIKSRIPTTESSPATAALKSAQEKDFEKQTVAVPVSVSIDDNRTDEVLAAAEILANGIGFPTTAPITVTSNDLKAHEIPPILPDSTKDLPTTKDSRPQNVSATTEIPPRLIPDSTDDLPTDSKPLNMPVAPTEISAAPCGEPNVTATPTESESAEKNLFLNEVIAELEISTDFPQNEIAEVLISKEKRIQTPKETELPNDDLLPESTFPENAETPRITELSIKISKIQIAVASGDEKKVESPIDSMDLPNISYRNCSTPKATEDSIENQIESLNIESPILNESDLLNETPTTAEAPIEEQKFIETSVQKRTESTKDMNKKSTLIRSTVRTNNEIPSEKSIETKKEFDFQKNVAKTSHFISTLEPQCIDIPNEPKVEIEFVNTQSPMVNLDDKTLETEVAITLPNENSVENPIEIVSIDFLNKETTNPIPSPGESRDENALEFEVPNDFGLTKNPMLGQGQKSAIENPIEIDVPNEFCKKRASMLSPGDSECSLSLLEQIDKLLTPIQRSDSVDEFELFRAFSPNNTKRILGEAGHIPLPLKKRRKLSEYSEENIQYKEEDECSESIDLDGVLNLKILPKTKQQTPLVLPSALVKSNCLSELEQKEISYPSEPMLSIAHFEEEEYKEITKELNFNKRQYPSTAPPKYSEVMRDFQPIVAHQQTQFRPPEVKQQLVQVPQVRPTPLPLQPTPQIPTVQTINIGYPIQNPYMSSNNHNKPPAYPTTTIRIDSVPSGNTSNMYPGSQPVNLANVNMDYNGHSHPIQITQTLCNPQSCMYNQRPPPTPTPEHVTKDFDIHSLLNLQNYDLNQTYLNNFLHNRQFNYQAGKSLMANSFCHQSGCFQQNENTQMLKNHSMSESHQCSAHTSRRSIIPKCGLCPACKELVAEMIVTYNTEVPQVRSQRQQEHKQQQDLQQMHRYRLNSPPIPQQQPTTTLPKKRGRPRKIITPPLPTNRVTRSANRANQKKKEEPVTEYYAFNVSETTKISPPAGKKRKYNSKPK